MGQAIFVSHKTSNLTDSNQSWRLLKQLENPPPHYARAIIRDYTELSLDTPVRFTHKFSMKYLDAT